MLYFLLSQIRQPLAANVPKPQKMETDKNFINLFETKNYTLGKVFEDVFLIDKIKKNEVFLASVYGEVDTGFINEELNKCIFGGVYLLVYDILKNQLIEFENLNDIFEIRKSHLNCYEILTDPWNKNSAIWEINLENMNLKKVKNFTGYIEKEYVENVNW